MKEAQIQTLFGKWLEAHPDMHTHAYELKLCKSLRFPFSAVKQHQIDGLLKAKEGMYYKISDSPIFGGMKTRFTSVKPFDCLWVVSRESYVVVVFYIPRKKKVAYLIPISRFIGLKQSWHMRSLTEEDCKQLFTSVDL